jgi:hypothetical protein
MGQVKTANLKALVIRTGGIQKSSLETLRTMSIIANKAQGET